MQNFQTWLETPETVRVILVQIDRTATPEYLSTHSVTVDGISYLGILKNGFDITESINTDYSANISYGTVDIVNGNGERDSWLTNQFIWVNKPIRVYVGGLPKPGVATSLTNDFELIFDGIIADIDAKDRFTLSFKVRDKLEKLNTSISETLLGNYYNGQNNVNTATYDNQNKTKLKPICFGEVFNVTPLLTDPVYLEYMVNNGDTELIIDVRDNGVPVTFTTGGTIPQGSFRLTKSPAGTVTCSLQGIKTTVDTTSGGLTATYDPSAKNTILTILRGYGKTLSANEIDLASFASNAYGAEAVGIYLADRANVLQLCQDLAKSCGCVLAINNLGKVRLINLQIPSAASTAITDSDVLLNSLVVSKRIEVVAAIKIGAAKNYTIQNNLVTSIPQDHKDSYATEYYERITSDVAIKNSYSIELEPSVEPGYLINNAEADAVALKKLNLFKAGRVVYKMNCTAKFLSAQLGDAVKLTFSRFGLSNTFGLVIGVKPDWIKGTVELEVLV